MGLKAYLNVGFESVAWPISRSWPGGVWQKPEQDLIERTLRISEPMSSAPSQFSPEFTLFLSKVPHMEKVGFQSKGTEHEKTLACPLEPVAMKSDALSFSKQ